MSDRFRYWRRWEAGNGRPSLIQRIYKLREWGNRYRYKIEMRPCARGGRSRFSNNWVPLLAYMKRS